VEPDCAAGGVGVGLGGNCVGVGVGLGRVGVGVGIGLGRAGAVVGIGLGPVGVGVGFGREAVGFVCGNVWEGCDGVAWATSPFPLMVILVLLFSPDAMV